MKHLDRNMGPQRGQSLRPPTIWLQVRLLPRLSVAVQNHLPKDKGTNILTQARAWEESRTLGIWGRLGHIRGLGT